MVKRTKGVPGINGHLLNTVSLYSEGDQLIFGQKATEAKGWEIAIAINLFEKINISVQIITGDSTFCYQHAIDSLIKNKAFILQIKKESAQPILFHRVKFSK